MLLITVLFSLDIKCNGERKKGWWKEREREISIVNPSIYLDTDSILLTHSPVSSPYLEMINSCSEHRHLASSLPAGPGSCIRFYHAGPPPPPRQVSLTQTYH